MHTAITLPIPDSILQKARLEADRTHQSVEAVLLEALAETYTPYAVHPERHRMLTEIAAFEAMHAALVKSHLGQFVALYGGEVVDSDFTLDALVERIQTTYPDKIVLIEEVQATLPPPVGVPTLRFRGIAP